MIYNLEKIGRLIRENKIGRVKYHPLVRSFNLSGGVCNKIKYNRYLINIDTKNMTMSEPEEVPLENVCVLKYDIGGKNFPYLIGNFEWINNNKKTKNRIELCASNICSKNIEDDIFVKFYTVIENNIDIINSLMETVKFGNGIILNIKIDNLEFYEIDEILDKIDKLYIYEMTKLSGNQLLLKNSLFSFFNSGEKISQTPNFNFENSYKSLYLTEEIINNLIYSVHFHNALSKTIIGNYKLVYIPNYDELTYEVLDECLTNRNETIKEIIKNKDKISKIASEQDIDYLLNFGFQSLNDKESIFFDLIFQQEGQANVDLSIIKNYSLKNLEKLNNKIQYAKKESGCNFYNLKKCFSSFFTISLPKSDKKNEHKGQYDSKISYWILQIFQNKYYKNNYLNGMLIKKIEFIFRNEQENNIEYEYKKVLNEYKFLKFMEKNGMEKEMKILDSESYKLGIMLGVLSQVWQEDRKNLKRKVEIFNGLISRKIKTFGDVINRLNEVQEMLERNGSWYDKLNATKEYNDSITNFGEKFNKDNFIMGYFYGLYKNNETNKEKSEN